MNYELVDNFLPEWYFNHIKNIIYSDSFPWYMVASSSGAEEIIKTKNVYFPKNQNGFFHLAYNHFSGGPTSSAYQVFEPILNLISEKFDTQVYKLIRIRLGLTTNIGMSGSHYPHVDAIYPHKTLLYYFNDSDGDTIFYNKKYGEDTSDGLKIEYQNTPKENQAILFDGLTYHSSSFPTQNFYRMTMNINFQETEMFDTN